MRRLGWFRRISLHHIVVEQCRTSEETKASGRTEDAAEDVLGGLLEPVSDGVFEHLVPHQRTYRINSTYN